MKLIYNAFSPSALIIKINIQKQQERQEAFNLYVHIIQGNE